MEQSILNNITNRNGMACIKRSKECTIVPKDHVGAIPGVAVGTCWRFRFQVSESGVHRPMVAGIHGRSTKCAYSIVLSGGYGTDIDNGNEVCYTGSGGRDLSGNKRTVNQQTSDQTLTKLNKALALNCNAKFNAVVGAEAKKWREGIPVRVVRNYKLAKHSRFSPLEGNRYDGLYKVVKYYPYKEKSGFIVWIFVLRRDDPSPAPWEDGAEQFEMIYPDGYLEAENNKENRKIKADKLPKIVKKSVKKMLSNSPKIKINQKREPYYKLDKDVRRLIKSDQMNQKLWNECLNIVKYGKSKFLKTVRERFACACCKEIVYKPITLICSHNACKNCLIELLNEKLYSCPVCEFHFSENFKLVVNEKLNSILSKVIHG